MRALLGRNDKLSVVVSHDAPTRSSVSEVASDLGVVDLIDQRCSCWLTETKMGLIAISDSAARQILTKVNGKLNGNSNWKTDRRSPRTER